MQPYIDEDTFFSGYTTVDEKEASEAYGSQCRADQVRRRAEAQAAFEENRKRAREIEAKSRWNGNWFTNWWYLFLVVVIVGCVKACNMTTPSRISSSQFTSPSPRLSTKPAVNVPSLLPSQHMKISYRPGNKPIKYKMPEFPKTIKVPKLDKKLKAFNLPEVSKAPEVSKISEVANAPSSPAPIASPEP